MRPLSRLEQLALVYQFLTRYRAVERFPFLSQEAIREHQFRRITQLIAIAYHYTPFYRQKYHAAGIHPSDIRGWDDFKRLPTVTKDELIAYSREMVDLRRSPARLIVSRSSGSSGRFATVYLDSQNFIEQELQVIRMLKEFYPAYHPLDRELLIYTSEYPVRSIAGLYRVNYISNLAAPARILAELRRVRPALVAIYPSILRELAEAYGPACRTLGIKAIITNSEHASQEERDHLAAVFGCGVFDEFSSEEIASIAQQCAHKAYHLVQDCSYVELLEPDSDREVGPGQEGEIVGTCLINRAMPIIRYRQGDLAVLSDEGCSCGKTAPHFAALAGRKNASFKRRGAPDIPSGRILDWSYDLVLKLGLDIRAFQITQISLGCIKVSIVAGAGYDPTSDSAKVVNHFGMTFGHDFEVVVELVPQIEKTRAGKHIPIRSLVQQSGTHVNHELMSYHP